MFAQTVVFLLAAVVAVPLARRAGLGAVLGYLLAGILIGPSGLALVGAIEDVRHVAELGVVLLLFVIGLELNPRRLWTLRRPILGAGISQLVASALALAAVGVAFGLPPEAAAVCGLALALSSTAFALQVLAERKELTARHGRLAFAVLLFQDLAAIPVLALLPLLGAEGNAAGHAFSLSGAVVTVAAVVIGGHFLLRPALRLVAGAGAQEVFTAAALLIAVGTAWLMELAGLSAALGAFLAGVLLADSQYRHALEADIEPFKGLLLGLFFMTVGMGVDLTLLAARPGTVVGLGVGLVVVKAAVLLAVGWLQGLDGPARLRLAASLSQGGEFAFVILGVATAAGLVAAPVTALLVLVVSLSMMLTPLLLRAVDALRPRGSEPPPEFDRPEFEHPVVIAGFGRFGQIVGRILQARRIPFTALDASSEHVEFVRRYGGRVHYGDAARLEVLRAAGAGRCRLFVLAIGDPETSLRAAALLREHFPQIPVYARARDRRHAYRLMDLGARVIIRETLLSSIEMARHALEALGIPRAESERLVQTFRQQDEARLREDHAVHDDEARLIHLAKSSAAELEEMFARDAASAPGSATAARS